MKIKMFQRRFIINNIFNRIHKSDMISNQIIYKTRNYIRKNVFRNFSSDKSQSKETQKDIENLNNNIGIKKDLNFENQVISKESEEIQNKSNNTELEQNYGIFEYSVDPFLSQGQIQMKSYDSNEIKVAEKHIQLPFLMHGVQHPPEKKIGILFFIYYYYQTNCYKIISLFPLNCI